MIDSIKYMNIDELIEHLESKGLVIKNKKTAKNYLLDVGYYKLINGYRQPFTYIQEENGVKTRYYYENVSIEDLYNLYEFDRELKSLILKYLSYIETKTKNKISELISSKYGIKESEYLVAENFKPDETQNQNSKKFCDIKKEIERTLKEKRKRHKSISWYATNYEFYPFWVLSNILTFGTISLIYSKMKEQDQNTVARHFLQKPDSFGNMLMFLVLFRNACAHDEVVYNYKTFRSLKQKDIYEICEKYNIEKDSKTGLYQKGVNDIFALIIIFKKLLSKRQFSEFITKLKFQLRKLHNKIDQTKYDEILLSMGIVGELDILKRM